ncbi:MAG: zf-HC2 domain-containing protein [Terriglobales bacterium]|jgi:putative zinc finger protein
MTCSDVERMLPEILDGAPDGAFQTAFDLHLKSCPECSDLVSDLKLITNEAQYLAASDEPSPRVWVRIEAQLRAEGLIREAQPVRPRPTLVPALLGRRWGAWLVAPVAAALVAAGSYVVSHRPAPSVVQQQTPPSASPAPSPGSQSSAATEAASLPATPASDATASETASTTAAVLAPVQQPAPRAAGAKAVEPVPSPEDEQFLSAVSTRAPSLRATYENQLQAVNADIRETQAYVDRNPGDIDARQHLMDAYQQKALLYQIALDRIQ